MATLIQVRRGSAAVWAAVNPVLAAGEFGVALDTRVTKVGDGATAWNDLPALAVDHADSADVADALATPRTINGVAFDGSANIVLPSPGEADVTGLVADLALLAPLASPALSGVPTGPTAAPGTNTTQLATTAYTRAAIAALVDSSPGTLDTLNELATALGDDANFATTMTTALAVKVATTRTVNGHALSADVVVTKGDVGLGAVENTALSTWAGSAAITTIGPLPAIVVGGAVAPSGVEGYFASTSAADPRGLMSAQYSTDATGARLHLRKARGTEAAPTVVVTGDVLGRIRFSGYDGANFLQMAGIAVVATGTIAATRVPTYMTFSVATDAAPSVLTEVLRLSPSGITFSAPFVGAITTTIDGIGAVSTNGFVLRNTTPAAAGAQQYSPRILLEGQGWKTNATAASESVRFAFEVQPVQSTADPIGNLAFLVSVNNGAFVNAVTFSKSGDVNAIGNVVAGAAAAIYFAGRTLYQAPANGHLAVSLNDGSIGVRLKVDALPTVTAGGGTSPAVTAGSTPLAGSVNVGSGSPGASITITFGGTAFPSAPFPICMNLTTGLAVKATATTTTLVITPQTGNFGASDVISWHCISPK
jgi:hypothetical protein